MSQKSKILNILSDNQFHCVNEFIDTYCVDYRRRIKDIKDRGYILEGITCTLHNNHIGGSKMWRITGYPVFGVVFEKDVINHSPHPQNRVAGQIERKNEQKSLFSLPQTLHNLRA